MCERMAGAAGTPRAPRRRSVLLVRLQQGGFFTDPDGIRLGYD
jgi:hypothetical protein